jgi:hypothetical protein
MGVGVQHHAPAALTTGKKPDAQYTEGAPGPVRMSAENLASTGIRFPDHPADSDSILAELYWLPPWNEVVKMKHGEWKGGQKKGLLVKHLFHVIYQNT